MFVVVNVQVSLVNSTFEVLSLSTIYIAPPLVAMQSVKERVFSVSVFDAGILAYIAPPLPDGHLQEEN